MVLCCFLAVSGWSRSFCIRLSRHGAESSFYSASWSFAYTIDVSDNGNYNVVYTVYDYVGNSNTCTYDFTEDNVNPTLTDVLSAYNEDSGDVGEIFGNITENTIYFSNRIKFYNFISY